MDSIKKAVDGVMALRQIPKATSGVNQQKDKRRAETMRRMSDLQFRDVRTYIDALTTHNYGYINDWKSPEWLTPHISLDDCWRDAMQMFDAYANNDFVV